MMIGSSLRRLAVRWFAAGIACIALTAPAAVAAADDAAFDGLLQRYVAKSPDGITRVDYGKWKASATDVAALDAVIKSHTAMTPSKLGKPEQFAYWANLYNAVTLKVILANYPVASIRDIKSKGIWLDPKAFTGPWVEKRVEVEGRSLSLDDIEHVILRPEFKDPRVHYAVNCASIGCPNLRPATWKAATLEKDLDEAARDYVNHPRGASFDGDKLVVASIYSWFKADFGGTDGGVIAHMQKYAGPALAKKLANTKSIGRHAYDWSLNDAKGGETGAIR